MREPSSKPAQLFINQSDPLGMKAYQCEYCPSWHKIPGFSDEKALLNEAKIKFEQHMEELFSREAKMLTLVATSTIVILSNN